MLLKANDELTEKLLYRLIPEVLKRLLSVCFLFLLGDTTKSMFI